MSVAATYPMTCRSGHFGGYRWTTDGRRYCATCRSDDARRARAARRLTIDAPLRASDTTTLERTDSHSSLDSRPERRVEHLGPAVVLGDDGIQRYRIDEWRRRFGAPPVAYGQIEDDR